MSLDKLAIIFFIIILPISVVLSAYTNAQVDTLNMQVSYDNKLKSATYDAVKAFQTNTLNSSTSDLANSKIRDIEASVNAFFNSMSTNFNVAGYNTNTLQEYVPALVYTMYDGYYIYSPYTNTIPGDTYKTIQQDGTEVDNAENATYKNGDKLYGLKPYIYYSCEYETDNGSNFVITYSLDNYITIQGKIVTESEEDKWINDSGYLISNIQKDGERLEYREIEIENNQNLMQDYLIRDDSTKNGFHKYQKINGVKYYYDSDPTIDKWFSILNGEEIYTNDRFKDNDSSAYNYYSEADAFMERIEAYGLGELTANEAVDSELKSDYKIFDFTNIEEPNSDFNQHRLAVIRHSIEKNLSIAIANYNNYTSTKTEFLMPELKEDEWDRILNNISIISFMQGLDIGAKVYNGYAIVANNNNEELVTENSIYIVNHVDSTYHNILENGLNSKIHQNFMGIFNMDLQRRVKETDLSTQYYYPKPYYADYDSVVYQTNVINLDDYDGNIYKYMDANPNLAKIYYNALGRERYGMYKVNRNVQELLEKYK